MLNLDEGMKAVKFARGIIENYVKKDISSPQLNLGEIFEERQGVFVTLHTHPDHSLRGCIGIPLPVMPLKEAIIESAQSAARDPRFPPLKENEINKVIIEVTILSKPELINVNQPEEHSSHIVVGRDGLIVEQGVCKGLLLPQVPIEQGWDKEEFLSNTCTKAGLMPDAWLDRTTKIFKFSGQIFSEVEPGGKIKEKTLDGSNN